MNFLCRKGRNNLESDRVNKLTYTYINTRIFHRINSEYWELAILNFNELTEEEEVQLEDELLQNKEMSDIDKFDRDEGWFFRWRDRDGVGHEGVYSSIVKHING